MSWYVVAGPSEIDRKRGMAGESRSPRPGSRGRRLRPALAALAVAAGLLVTATAQAQFESVTPGDEQLVSATGDTPAIAMNAQGRGVIAWSDGSIQARTFAADGLRPQFAVNTAPGTLLDPRVAIDARGGFVVVWSGREVRGQVYRGEGRRRGGELTLSPRNVTAAHPEVAMAADGRFVVAWEQSTPDPSRAVRLATFTAGGGRMGRPLTMPAIGTMANLVGAVSASADSVAVGWTEFTPCPSNPIDPVSAVMSFRWSLALLRDVDRLANDNPCVDGPQVLALQGSDYQGPLGIFVGRRYSIQRFSSADGERFGPRTNVAELPACGATDCARVVAVAGDQRGRFVFVWERFTNGHYELSGEFYGREGERRVESFPISTGSSTAPQHAAAAMTSDGTLVVTWRRSGTGIVVRRFRVD